jgi:hypothetical protein
MLEVFSKNKVIPDGEDPVEFCRAMFDPRKSFRGFKTKLLIEQARATLPPDLHGLLETPLGFLHLDELNGFAARSPRGNAVIIMNMGILLHAQMLGRCALAVTTYSSAQPFCRDHEPAAFVHAIICLARYVHSADEGHMRRITVWRCPSIDPIDLKSAAISSFWEQFILLHEYGHVARGHLNASALTKKHGLDVYTLEHAQEYEADAFAFEHFCARHGQDRAAFTAALFFRFCDLVEHVAYDRPTASATHPCGRDRWQALKRHFDLDQAAPSASLEVESMFDMILSVRKGIDAVILSVNKNKEATESH